MRDMFEVELAKNLFKDAIKSSFNEEHIIYAFLTGPFTFGSAKHDIDMVVVIDNKRLNPLEKIEYQKRILKFVEKYLRIHKFLGYAPDLDFPSDVVTYTQIEDSINGRGFDVKDSKLYLRKIKTKKDYFNTKIDYRVYLWELITSCEGFILGDYTKYIVDKFRALNTILLYTISKLESGKVTLRDIKEKIFTLAGLDERYDVVSDYIEPMIVYMLRIMSFQGYIAQEDEKILLKKEKIREWEKSIIEKHRTNNWKGKPLFISWQILRTHAKNIIKEWL